MQHAFQHCIKYTLYFGTNISGMWQDMLSNKGSTKLFCIIMDIEKWYSDILPESYILYVEKIFIYNLFSIYLQQIFPFLTHSLVLHIRGKGIKVWHVWNPIFLQNVIFSSLHTVPPYVITPLKYTSKWIFIYMTIS